MYVRDTTSHPSKNQTHASVARSKTLESNSRYLILVFLKTKKGKHLLGSVVDHSILVEQIVCSITEEELSPNQFLIDVGIGVVFSMWKVKFLSPAAGCESFVAYMRR